MYLSPVCFRGLLRLYLKSYKLSDIIWRKCKKDRKGRQIEIFHIIIAE
jgi:hypothetical protein